MQIQGLFYDLMKARSKYERNYAKYTTLVQDAENNIKARDCSVHDFVNKGVRETEVYDGFLNRSLTKVSYVDIALLCYVQCCAVLCSAMICCAVLCCAVVCYAML
jgi:hypothetical protein